MANSKNKEIARKATEQIEKLKEEKNKLNVTKMFQIV